MKIIVVGGGPAGMAAAWAAARCGAEYGAEVTLLERNEYLGGVLPQCIHNGFGTQIYDRDLTGGEYSYVWEKAVREAGVTVMTGATVMGIGPDTDTASGGARRTVDCVCAGSGDMRLECDAVIAATGCRERTLPQMHIPGSRPAGVFTAGSAQLMMNIKNYMPGRSAVILGSGDIGLIMARRMTLEGMDVKMILGEKSTGLARNIVQCVEDFDIPMRYGWTVASTHGYRRLKGVSIREIATGRKEYIPCDTLLVAAGLVPETEIFEGCMGKPGFYICGNASHVHDLADNVTLEAVAVGAKAVSDRLDITGDVPSDIPKEVEELLSLRPEVQPTGKDGNIVCTVCPKGCIMNVIPEPFSVSGNECLSGEEFARREVSDPQRVVTTVIKSSASASGEAGIVSVRTKGTVGKDEIPKVMKAARKAAAPGPMDIGDEIPAGDYVFVVTGI